MRAANRPGRQGAKCVGAPPGRGRPCPRAPQEQCITGRPDPDRAVPSLARVTWRRSRCARIRRDRRCGPTPDVGCAGRRQRPRCVRTASHASVERYGAHGPCKRHSDVRSSRPAASAIQVAAPPSHTSAAARCRPATANRCVHRTGTENVAPLRGSAMRRRRRGGRLCARKSHVATGHRGGTAGTPSGGKPRCRRPKPARAVPSS